MGLVDTTKTYDYVVIGSGIGGLFTAALLANRGASVCVLERHYLVGGYAQSFYDKKYLFCAGLHYVFNSMPGEDGGIFLRELGLEKEITFTPMEEDSFDRLRFPDLSYDVKRGVDRNIEELGALFPKHKDKLKKYYDVCRKVYVEAFSVPVNLPLTKFVFEAPRLTNLLRYRNLTTQQMFDRFGFPVELCDVLSGQCGNIGLAPYQSSFIAHALNVMAYDQGACFPTQSYHHMIKVIEKAIKGKGGKVLVSTEARKIVMDGSKVTAVDTDKGEIKTKNVLFNGDPALLPRLMNGTALPSGFRRKLNYDYSPGSYTCYIGLKDAELEKHGFGNWNVWHYPQHDMNEIYRRQLDDGDVRDPFLAITTPTLHGAPGKNIAPKGHHQMVICTWAGYKQPKQLKTDSPDAYYKQKEEITNFILDSVEKHYYPGLRKHIDLLQLGTPTTNEDYVSSPLGNSYGANLTPKNVNLGKVSFFTPFKNLFLINATAGMPGLGGAFRSSLNLFGHLAGDAKLLKEITRRREISPGPTGLAGH